jgi:hypothetical protein
MSLPKQVQAQLEEIEQWEQDVAKANSPALDSSDGVDEQGQQPDQQDVTPLAQVEPTEPPKQPEDETWERRYKTLQGMFNAEVPRLKSEVNDLKNQLSTAIARLDLASEVKSEGLSSDQRLVTDKDVEDFGGDLVDLIKRQATEVAQSELSKKISKLEEENAQLHRQVDGVSERQGESSRRDYFAELSRLVPDYEDINVDQGFLDWLNEVDLLSGNQRQEYLNQAFNTFDPIRTATLFNTYKELVGAPTTSKQPNKSLERQVAPGTSRVSSASAVTGSDKVWSMTEIDRFYRDVAKGMYRGNDAEQVRIEADIDLAVTQGRLSK